MSLTREQILAAEDRPKKSVPCPEWGGEVWVKTLSAAQREEWEASLESRRDIRASLVVLAACDERGNALFTKDDLAALGQKSAPVIIRLFDAAQGLNSITADDVDALEKNSGASPSDSSVSGSPAN